MVFQPIPGFKATADLEMTGECVSHSRTDCQARDVVQSTDEPAARGGTNLGLTPTETLWASLLGCTNVIGHRVAERHGMSFKNMELKVEYVFDRRGAALVEEVEVPFPDATLYISVTSDADPELIKKVQTDLDRACPIFNVIKKSGCNLKSEWIVNKPNN